MTPATGKAFTTLLSGQRQRASRKPSKMPHAQGYNHGHGCHAENGTEDQIPRPS